MGIESGIGAMRGGGWHFYFFSKLVSVGINRENESFAVM